MPNWRPEGIYIHSHCAIKMQCQATGFQSRIKCHDCEAIQEASFDVMLEALRKQPHMNVSYEGKPGKWYFIPDDKEDGDL